MPSSSHLAWNGTISFSTKRRTVCRKISCSSRKIARSIIVKTPSVSFSSLVYLIRKVYTMQKSSPREVNSTPANGNLKQEGAMPGVPELKQFRIEQPGNGVLHLV